ncbi:unnamed protein product [Aphanomyces euteiches]
MTNKPLPPNYFFCPPLKLDEKEQLKQQGIAAAFEVAEKTQLHGGPIEWVLESDEQDMKIYKGRDPNSVDGASGSTLYFSSIEVPGSMDEVVDLFRSQTTEQAKEYVRRFGHLMTDQITLYSIVPATEDPQEMIGVCWRAFKPAVEKLAMRRDACLLDVRHAFTFKGKRVWVRCNKSIELACCPDLESELGFVRMTHHITGHIFSESDRPGYLHIDYIAHTDVKGSVGDHAKWIVDISLKKRCRNIQEINRYLRENRLSKTPFLNNSELVPTRAASKCYLCSRHFGMLSKKINCLKCGQVVCRRCIQLWNVKNRGFDAQAQVCNKCSLGNPDDFKLGVHCLSSEKSTSMRSDGGSSSGYDAYQPHNRQRVDPAAWQKVPESLNNYDLKVTSTGWKSARGARCLV